MVVDKNDGAKWAATAGEQIPYQLWERPRLGAITGGTITPYASVVRYEGGGFCSK